MCSLQDRWIVENRTSEALATLVCFPSAGSEPSLFRNLPRLDMPINKCVAQLPGKSARRNERPLTKIDDIVEDLFVDIGELGEAPLVFWGHSMGAWVAYRMAEKMKQAGESLPVHFVVSASLPFFIERRPPYVHSMSIEELAVELKCLGGTPELILNDLEFLEVFRPSIQADFKAFETYRHEFSEPLNIPTSVWVALDDPRIPMSAASHWNTYFAEEPNLSVFGGGHMFVLEDNNRQRIASHFEEIFSNISKLRKSQNECA